MDQKKDSQDLLASKQLSPSIRRMPWLRLHITNLCNFDCPGCHVFKISENKVAATNMPYEIAENAVIFFIGLINKFLPAAESFHLSIYGGEPLLNRPTLYKIMDKFGSNFKGLGINWIVNTNGSLLNEEDLKIFKLYGADIHMSVDGKEQKHNKTRRDKLGRDTYDRVMKSIDLIRQNSYPYLQFDSVANPFEMENMNDVLEVAEEKGVSRIHYDPYYSPEYPENFSVDDYAKKYAEAYIWGKESRINIFSTPFSQIYDKFLKEENPMRSQRVSAAFPTIEVFADGSFIFGELPLIRPFDFLSKIEQDEIWSRRIKKLMVLEEETESLCSGCYLKSHCNGQLRRFYRYHTITNLNEGILCDIVRSAVSKLNQRNFIPIKYVKR